MTNEEILNLRKKFNKIKNEIEILKSNLEAMKYLEEENVQINLSDDDLIKIIALHYKSRETEPNIYVYMGMYRYNKDYDTFDLIENSYEKMEEDYLVYYSLFDICLKIKKTLKEKNDFERDKIIINLKNPSFNEYYHLRYLYFKELISGLSEEETLQKVKEKYIN